MKPRQDQDQAVSAAINAAVITLSPAVKHAGAFGDGPSVLQFKKAVMEEAMGRRVEKQNDDGYQLLVYQYDDDLVATVIKKAIAGDIIADTVLREAASEKLQAGLPLPPNLVRYIVGNVLTDQIRTKHPGGRPDSFDRDVWIYIAVNCALKRGFKLARNVATKSSSSASSIVAAALLELGVAMSEKRVAEIWRDMRPQLSRYDDEQWWLV